MEGLQLRTSCSRSEWGRLASTHKDCSLIIGRCVVANRLPIAPSLRRTPFTSYCIAIDRNTCASTAASRTLFGLGKRGVFLRSSCDNLMLFAFTGSTCTEAPAGSGGHVRQRIKVVLEDFCRCFCRLCLVISSSVGAF